MKKTMLLTTSLFMAASLLAGDRVDSIQWQNPGVWSCARTIAVRPFDLTGPYKSDRPFEEYMERLVNQLDSLLRGRNGIESVVLDTSGMAAVDVVIEGQFNNLTNGSRAARFWLGTGAGASRCGVVMSAATPDGTVPIFRLYHERVSALGLKSDEVEENLDELVEDVAATLLAARGQCLPADQALLTPPATVGQATRNTAAAVAPVAAPGGTVDVGLESIPSGAEVYVDGEFVGSTPLVSYRLTAGKHALEMRKQGFEVWSRTLLVQEGIPVSVSAELVPVR